MSDLAEPLRTNTSKIEFHVTPSLAPGTQPREYALIPYNPQRQYDYVRLIVTVGLLFLFGFVIVWVAIKSATVSDELWKRTKDMLQIILPAITALIGSVLGFYFGTQSTLPPLEK